MCLRPLLSVQDRLSNISTKNKYVNGACVYMLCFQYRTDCLQHLPLQVCEWCMCLRVLLPVQDRPSSTSSTTNKYVNGACVYMFCFQYRTDCLQHLPLQVREWCMCLRVLLPVQDRLSSTSSTTST